jgi:hypothetical protein
MLMDVTILQGRYAPRQLIPPRSEVVYWTPVTRDKAGSETVELLCPDVTEVRFTKPAGAQKFHVTVRGRLNSEGAGDEWLLAIPAERMGMLYLPQGFTAEQSVMGAVYRLPAARTVRILADQIAGMPGLNFTLQVL